MPDVLPDIVIPVSERDRLQRLAHDAASDGYPVARAYQQAVISINIQE